MSLIKLEFDKDVFFVDPKFCSERNNKSRVYECLLHLIERKNEIFLNLLLFQNIIVKYWEGEISQDILILLSQAGMVLTNIRIWRDFIIAIDFGLETSNDIIVK